MTCMSSNRLQVCWEPGVFRLCWGRQKKENTSLKTHVAPEGERGRDPFLKKGSKWCLLCSICWSATQRRIQEPFVSRLARRSGDPPPVGGGGLSVNMSCVLHYSQMSEAVGAMGQAFSPTFCHLSPQPRPEGSCENWKWQSNQHVEQADWTKLSWPRSELFNTGPIGGLCCEGAAARCEKHKPKEGKRSAAPGGRGEINGS